MSWVDDAKNKAVEKQIAEALRLEQERLEGMQRIEQDKQKKQRETEEKLQRFKDYLDPHRVEIEKLLAVVASQGLLVSEASIDNSISYNSWNINCMVSHYTEGCLRTSGNYYGKDYEEHYESVPHYYSYRWIITEPSTGETFSVHWGIHYEKKEVRRLFRTTYIDVHTPSMTPRQIEMCIKTWLVQIFSQ